MVRLFKHYIPKSLLVMSMVEMLLCILAVYLGVLLRFDFQSDEAHKFVFSSALVFAAVVFSSMATMGLYQRHLRDGRRGMFIRICVAFAISFGVMSMLFYLFPEVTLGRGVFAYTFIMALAGVMVTRAIYIKVTNREDLKRRILIVGTGEKANLIETLLKRKTDRRGFKIVGYVSVSGEEVLVPENEVIQHKKTLMNIVEETDADEIVLAITDRRKGFPVEELLDCKMSGVEVSDIATLFERQSGRIILDLLHPSWLIFSDGFAHGLARDAVKRTFDIVASSLLLLFTFPIMLVTALLIYLEDRGPVFYRQVRVGKNWKLVHVMKFRSMRTDAEKNGVQWAKADDDRVTRIGKFIRKTRIDELPQMFNVLRGDMSFVGPRPERPQFVEQFSESIPFYAERHRVKPGVTGWAQISYPYGASEKDTIEKLQYDLYYVKNYSIFLDLTVLFQTAEVILWGKGAR